MCERVSCIVWLLYHYELESSTFLSIKSIFIDYAAFGKHSDLGGKINSLAFSLASRTKTECKLSFDALLNIHRQRDKVLQVGAKRFGLVWQSQSQQALSVFH